MTDKLSEHSIGYYMVQAPWNIKQNNKKVKRSEIELILRQYNSLQANTRNLHDPYIIISFLLYFS